MKIKDFIFSLSLANLCFFKVYAELFSIDSNPGNHYYVRSLPAGIDYLAFILSVLLLAILIWVFMAWGKNHSFLSIIMGLGVALVSMGSIFWGLRLQGIIPVSLFEGTKTWIVFLSASYPGISLVGLAALIGLGLIFARALMIRSGRIFLKGVTVGILALSPLVIVTFSYAALHLFKTQKIENFSNKPPSPIPAKGNVAGSRVVVLLFDELDYRLAFAERPSGLQLPEMDRFRLQAVFASNAYPPANTTLMSTPALITGHMISKAESMGADELLITLEGKENLSWGKLPNIFSEARELGFSSGLIGWMHPYSRILGANLDECYWYELARITNSTGDTLFSKIINQFRSLFETPTFSLFGQSLTAKRHIATYFNLREDALKLVGKDDHDLVFIHFPVPHAPNIYDPIKKDFSVHNNMISGYVGNLALADRTLGEIRQYMENKGTWDRSAIIITSDHWWRYSTKYDGKNDHRVPFLVKLAGQRESIAYEPVFNTVIIHDLILNLLRSKNTDPKKIVDWLNQNGKPLSPIEGPDLD